MRVKEGKQKSCHCFVLSSELFILLLILTWFDFVKVFYFALVYQILIFISQG